MPRPSLITQLRSLPAAAWILFGGSFVNRFGAFVMPMLAIYLTRQGYSVARAGAAVGAYGAGHLVASLAGGHLADRIGRRNTIALSMFASAIAMLLLSQARGYAAIIVLTMLAGTATELYRPASHALIGDLVAPDQRVIAFGMYRFAVNLGFAAGPATAGFLADRSFLLIFAGDAISSAAFGTIALLALPHGLRFAMEQERFGEAFRVAMRDARFMWFLAATALVAMIDFQLTSTFALHVKAAGFPASTYGMLASLNGLLIVFFELLITSRTQRLNPQPVIAVGYALAGIGFALTGFAHSVPALAATVVVWTIGEMLSSPLSGAYVAHLAPERYRGRYMGMLALMFSVGMMAGPTIGTLLFQRSEAILWATCGVVGLLSAALALLAPRHAKS
jgi:MFS family permease